MISFKQVRLTESEIFNYLKNNDDTFVPTLSSRLNIPDFSRKLSEMSVHFCAFDDGCMIGLLAGYFNNNAELSGFISSLSVKKEYQSRGIASTLLDSAIEYGKSNEFKNIKLEVRNENKPALRIYQKAGFTNVSSAGNKIVMELKL
jgi:GNAT superfamily N-acetyltransferase